jgi:copper chaperone
MKIIKFKTNIKCEGCVAGVAPHLNGSDKISDWQVDTDSQDKVLSVAGEQIEPHEIQELVEKAGFEAEVLRIQGIGGGDL